MSDELMEEVSMDRLLNDIKNPEVVYRDTTGKLMFPNPITYGTNTSGHTFTYSSGTNTWEYTKK